MSAPLRPDLADCYERFVLGQSWQLGGLDLRIGRGAKQASDLVLEWRTPAGWRRVPMSALFVMVDFLYENEHRIYPPRMGYDGGELLRKRLAVAVREGYQRATEMLTAERTSRLARGDRRDTA